MIFSEEFSEEYPFLRKYTSPVKQAERPIVGRDVEMDRIMAAMMRPELCNVMLLAEAGSGKAQPVDTWIPVADDRGYVRLGDIKVGDFVFDENGNPVKVLGVFPQGLKRAYGVGFTDGTSAICNNEHLWSARTRSQHNENRPYFVYTLQGMMDYGDMWYVPCNKAVQRDSVELPIEPYALGVSIANGFFTDIQMHNLVQFLDDDVLDEKNVIHCIPKAYLIGSMEQRFDLLCGLMDTDDPIDSLFSTISLELCEDVRALAASLGYRTLVHETEQQGVVEYSVCFRMSDDIAIESVTDLGYDTDMVCIYVDCPSHLYQTGKEHIVTHNTALVQGTMLRDDKRYYLEVDLSHMISDLSDANQMADRLKTLFNETESYCKKESQEIVLFIDEFHQIVQLSSAAVEVLKPLLADSGTRGIRVIAATTYVEFRKWISPNQPLVERLQRINLEAPSKKMVVQILRGMARRYGVDNQFYNNHLFELIYEYTNRYIPANAQPRKSILILDSMVGWYRFAKRKLNTRLLADVIYESEGVNVAFRVDATTIKKELDAHVFAQEFATRVIQDRLQICVADLNDTSRPMASFLFTGSSGVGKEIADSELIPVYTPDGSMYKKRNGDLQVGDFVFNRLGKPVEVLGVFPQGVKDVYEVELTDGRVIRCGAQHLWQYKSRFGNGSKHWKIADTQTLMQKYKNKYYNHGKKGSYNIKFVIPMNQPVVWPEKKYRVDPYVFGALLGNGMFTSAVLSILSDDVFVVDKIMNRIGSTGVYRNHATYSWAFVDPNAVGNRKYYQTTDLFADVPEMIGLKSHEKFIPDCYKYGSIDQRWELIRGLFDTNGHIDGTDKDQMRFNVMYDSTSMQLLQDIQDVLYSLGVSSQITGVRMRNCKGKVHKEWHLHVQIGNSDKYKFFSLPRKLEIAMKARDIGDLHKKRVKKFGETIGIRDIRKLDEKESMTCIYVKDEEHLYQAGQYIVTHNTEVTKQLARILFNDDRRLIRFDMTEYASEDSLEMFKRELTARVWERPYSIVLLDEIEKACAPVTRVLLQVLDDGRLSDENNREVSFINSYIIMTTNAGSEIYKDIGNYDASDTGSGVNLRKYEKLIRESISTTTGSNRFPPELLGRIDTIVPFWPLSQATQVDIVKTKLQKLCDSVRDKHNISVSIDKKVVDYIVKDNLDTNSDSGGARAVVSKINSEVVTAVASYINAYPDVSSIIVTVVGDMAYADKSKLESSASIAVFPFNG